MVVLVLVVLVEGKERERERESERKRDAYMNWVPARKGGSRMSGLAWRRFLNTLSWLGKRRLAISLYSPSLQCSRTGRAGYCVGCTSSSDPTTSYLLLLLLLL